MKLVVVLKNFADPSRGVVALPVRRVEVSSLEEARQAMFAYQDETGLGMGSLPYVDVLEGRFLKYRMSYNGRARVAPAACPLGVKYQVSETWPWLED